MKRSWLLATGAVTAVLAVILLKVSPSLVHRTSAAPAASFVGSNACRSCHSAEVAQWSRSHHAVAMQTATDSTVLGRFDGSTVQLAGRAHSFLKRNGKFFVRTSGADGQAADFQVAYTFGVYPLQQYLIALGGGRLQALTLAWDTRPAASGGQRWFALYPDSRSSADELHWTRPSQNWNYMCADCHSTNVKKNYVAAADSFHTTWSEVSVGCEACHGPGSRHIAWAAGRSQRDTTKGLSARLDERHGVTWLANASNGNSVRSRARTTDRELQVCAQCHSRRSQLSDGYTAGKPFFDYYLPALLSGPLYHADGQQRGEVYEWGSFLQSRMNARGVTCSDCHDPHSGRLRATGNGVCAQCHSAAKYDAPAHHHHAQTSVAAACVSCHMPATTYMQVDARRDHSFRIPRPDLSAQLGTPNACASCHANRDARWAAKAIVAWRGGDSSAIGFQRYASAFAAATKGASNAQRQLSDVADDSTQPPIARATALAELLAREDRATLGILSKGLNDPNPLVRIGALRGASGLSAERRGAFVASLLADSVRDVRVEALRLQAGTTPLSTAQQEAFDRVAREYVDVQQFNADRADGRTNLGTFYAERGDFARAVSELREAIRLDPFFPPAYVNLADVFRAAGSARDAEGEQVLRDGLSRAPTNATLHHALGLALTRLNRHDEALVEFHRATELDPVNARFGYVYAVALHSAGKVKESIAELNRVLKMAPDDPDVLTALASFSGKAP